MDSLRSREGGYALKKDTLVSIEEPTSTKDALTEVLREGAQKLLAEAGGRMARVGNVWFATATCPSVRFRLSYYYQARPRDDRQLLKALRCLAFRYRRWGYQTLTDLLRREGFRDNHKRIYRVYREERLQVRRRQQKRVVRWRGEHLERPQGRNEIWAMDFMSDQPGGRKTAEGTADHRCVHPGVSGD